MRNQRCADMTGAGSWLVGGQGVDVRVAGLQPMRVHSFRKRSVYERR